MDDPCREMQDLLAGRILGLLDEKQANVLNDHLSRCLKCRKYLQSLEDENRLLVRFSEGLETAMIARRDRVIQALNRAGPTTRTEALPMSRTIMKSKIAKVSAAAVIMMAVVVGLVTILQQSATPAYAIEQTIEAFKDVNTVYYVTVYSAGCRTETWARRGGDGKFLMGDYRMQSSGGMTAVASDRRNVTYQYNEIEKILHIYKGITQTTGSWLDIDFYELLRDEMEGVNVTQVRDKHTGNDCVSVTFKVPEKYKGVGRSGVILFDVESKLPVRMTIWDNENYKGQPFFEVTEVIYNPEISEEIFDFEIPEGAIVIEQEQD